MKLRFTYHAQSQALARDIHESRVAETIKIPDNIRQAPGDAVAYQKSYERGILEVICKKGKQKNEYLILSMYYR